MHVKNASRTTPEIVRKKQAPVSAGKEDLKQKEHVMSKKNKSMASPAESIQEVEPVDSESALYFR